MQELERVRAAIRRSKQPEYSDLEAVAAMGEQWLQQQLGEDEWNTLKAWLQDEGLC